MNFIGKKRKIIKKIIKQKPKSETSFLLKLYTILNDKKYIKMIKWCDDGHSFIIYNVSNFAKNVLPNFFNHHNFTSFVRQLNLYNFHKVKTGKKGEQKYTHNEFNKKKTIEEIKLIKKKNKSENNNDLPFNHSINFNSLDSKMIVNISSNIAKDITNIEKKENSFEESKKKELIHAIPKNESSSMSNDKLLSFFLDQFEESNKEQKKVENEMKELVKLNNNLMEQLKICNNKILYQNEALKKMKVMGTFLTTLLLKKIQNDKNNNQTINKDSNDNKEKTKQKEKLAKFFYKYIEYKKIRMSQIFPKNNNLKALTTSITNINNTKIQKGENFTINQDIFQDNHFVNENDLSNFSLNKNLDLDFILNLKNMNSSQYFGDLSSLKQSRISRFGGRNNLFNFYNYSQHNT